MSDASSLLAGTADHAAQALAAEIGCEVKPWVAGQFEAVFPRGVLIGTMEEIRAWHRESRASALREWLAVLGTQEARA